MLEGRESLDPSTGDKRTAKETSNMSNDIDIFENIGKGIAATRRGSLAAMRTTLRTMALGTSIRTIRCRTRGRISAGANLFDSVLTMGRNSTGLNVSVLALLNLAKSSGTQGDLVDVMSKSRHAKRSSLEPKAVCLS